MNEKRYKAKMRYYDEFIYGNLVHHKYLNECIEDDNHGLRAIDPKSLQILTNILDRNGNEICINDIILKDLRKGIIINYCSKPYIKWIDDTIEPLNNKSNIELI